MGKRGARLTASRALMSLASVQAELSEASAYRITPQYVYAFRKKKSGSGITTARYLHANIHKYWEYLVDPSEDSPLANVVIGTIPAYYKAATDLKPKDKTKTLADLLTPEGPSQKDLNAVDGDEPEEEEDDLPSEVKAIVGKMGYGLKSSEANVVHILFLAQNDSDSIETLKEELGGDDYLEQATSEVFGMIGTLEGAGILKMTKKGNLKFNPVVASPVVPVGPVVVPVAPPPVPVPAPAPVPAPVAAPVPAPIPAPAPPTPAGKLNLGSLSAPPAGLTYAGDAKGVLGGYHAKSFLEGGGKKYLFKPSDKSGITAPAGVMYANLAAKILGSENVVPVSLYKYGGEVGSVQPMLPNIAKNLKDVPLTTLSKTQLDDLMRERVADWALSSHDTKAANFVILDDGRLVGIDKEQAFRHLLKKDGTIGDSLDTSYKPNPTPQVYSELFDLYRNKKIDLGPSLPAMAEALDKLDDIYKDEWVAQVQPYIDALGDTGVDTPPVGAAIMQRKASTREDLEKFLTGLMRERGDIAITDNFTFEGLKKKKMKEYGANVSAPSMGGGTSVPPLSALTHSGEAVGIGGAGEKHFFTDATGKKWLLKIAANKGSSGGGAGAAPFKAVAQEIFSDISAQVRPGKNIPVVSVPEGFNGSPATLQPWLGDNLQTLSGVSPSSLSKDELKDVGEEHILDWMMSQHDTHGGNLMRVPGKGIVSIDKEQGFKYIAGFKFSSGNSIDTDKLSTDFHPNSAYGEKEPYYNTLWRDFADDKVDFDPTALKGAIERIEQIPDSTYKKQIAKFAAVAPWKDDPKQVEKFLTAALERKQNIRKEFEEFITKQYKKKKKYKEYGASLGGSFTFDKGWVAGGGASTGASATPSAAPSVHASVQSLVGGSAPNAQAVQQALAVVKQQYPPSAVKANAVIAGLQAGKTPNEVKNDLISSGIYQQGKSAQNAVDFIIDKMKEKYASATGGVLAPTPAKKKVESVVYPMSPQAQGALGMKTVKLYDPNAPTPPPAPIPTPAGFPTPPAGMMWEVTSADQFAADFLYKAKDKKDSSGNPMYSDPEKLYKFKNITPENLKKALSDLGLTTTAVPSASAEAVLMDSNAWNAAITSGKKIGFLVPSPSAITPPKDKLVVPLPGQLKNDEIVPNSEEIADLDSNKQIGYGKGFFLDGGAVEQQSMSVQRRVDPVGKPYYRFTFRIRETEWQKFKGGVDSKLYVKKSEYDAASDSWKEANTNIEIRVGFKEWNNGDSSILIGEQKAGGADDFSFRGAAFADIYPKDDQNPSEALREMLSKVDPAFADKVVKNPTPEEQEVMAFSSMLYNIDPQASDELREKDRTPTKLHAAIRLGALKTAYYIKQAKAGFFDPNLYSSQLPRQKLIINETQGKDIAAMQSLLLKVGMSQSDIDDTITQAEADMANFRFERTGIDRVSPVVPDRHKRLQKLGLTHIQMGVGYNASDVSQLMKSGPMGIVQRVFFNGNPAGGSSYRADIQTGCADFLCTRLRTKDDAHLWGASYGDYQVVIDPSELDRLDVFASHTDNFGACSPTIVGGTELGALNQDRADTYKYRLPLEAQLAAGSYETTFRRGIGINKAISIICNTETQRTTLIEAAKKQGITTVNGMALSDLVVAETSGINGASTGVYNALLKPAGY